MEEQHCQIHTKISLCAIHLSGHSMVNTCLRDQNNNTERWQMGPVPNLEFFSCYLDWRQ